MSGRAFSIGLDPSGDVKGGGQPSSRDALREFLRLYYRGLAEEQFSEDAPSDGERAQFRLNAERGPKVIINTSSIRGSWWVSGVSGCSSVLDPALTPRDSEGNIAP